MHLWIKQAFFICCWAIKTTCKWTLLWLANLFACEITASTPFKLLNTEQVLIYVGGHMLTCSQFWRQHHYNFWIIHFCHLHKRIQLVPYTNTYTLTRLQSLWTCAVAVSSLEATGTAGSLWRPSAALHCIAAGSAPGWGGASGPVPHGTRNTQTPPVQTNPNKKNQTRAGTKTQGNRENIA